MNNLVSIVLSLALISKASAGCDLNFDEKVVLSNVNKGESINFPLEYWYVTQGEFESEVKKEILKRESLPRVLEHLERTYKYAKSKKLERRVMRKADAVTVNYRGPDNGFNIDIHFSNVGGCWVLIGFKDWST